MNTEAMGKTRRRVEAFAVMFLFWVLLNGSLSVDVLVVGVVVATVVALLSGGAMTFLTDFHYTPKALRAALRYVVFFLGELVKANVQLAMVVLSPSLPINPAVVKVRTRLQSPMGRLLLANSITLTPGTLTVEMEDEWLYVHWVNTETTDVNAATDKIVAGFERYLEVMYG